jgi:hypothetical protein
MSQATKQLFVSEHFEFDPERPEEFFWKTRVINPKIASLAGALADAIVFREYQWKHTDYVDPLVAGLRESLRIIARQAVWATMTKDKAEAAVVARQNVGTNDATDSVSDSGRSVGDIPLPTLGEAGVRSVRECEPLPRASP